MVSHETRMEKLSSLKDRAYASYGTQERRWNELGFPGSVDEITVLQASKVREKIPEEHRWKFFIVVVPKEILLSPSILEIACQCLERQDIELIGSQKIQPPKSESPIQSESPWERRVRESIATQRGNFFSCLMQFGHGQPFPFNEVNPREHLDFGFPVPLEVVLAALCVQRVPRFWSPWREWIIASSKTVIKESGLKEPLPLCLQYGASTIYVDTLRWVACLRTQADTFGGFASAIFI